MVYIVGRHWTPRVAAVQGFDIKVYSNAPDNKVKITINDDSEEVTGTRDHVFHYPKPFASATNTMTITAEATFDGTKVTDGPVQINLLQ